MDASTLNSLFTAESLLSLQGSAAAALLIPNVLGYLIGPKFTANWKKWISFVIAMALALLVALLATDPGFMKWIMSFVNGFLCFASAVGINQGLDSANRSRGGVLGADSTKKSFFKSWF